MDNVIAMCGLICEDCRAFIATQQDSNELRRKVVELWSTEDEPLTLKDIDCDGCTVGKRLHSFCNVCDVRPCGLQKDVETCAHCNEFPCERIERHWSELSPDSGKKAKGNLLEVYKSRTSTDH